MAVKRQSPVVRQKKAEARAVKRQSPAARQKETTLPSFTLLLSHLPY